jgi:hypothetical protein
MQGFTGHGWSQNPIIWGIIKNSFLYIPRATKDILPMKPEIGEN